MGYITLQDYLSRVSHNHRIFEVYVLCRFVTMPRRHEKKKNLWWDRQLPIYGGDRYIVYIAYRSLWEWEDE